jgi:hypothetical protein
MNGAGPLNVLSLFIKVALNERPLLAIILFKIDLIVLFALIQEALLTWWFDLYLLNKVPKNKIFIDELTQRIEKANSLLEKYL